MNYIESKEVELKKDFTINIFKTVSAYANYDGGAIYIGVTDDGSVVGTPNSIDLKLKIENTINDVIKPRPNYGLKVIRIGNKDVLEVTVLGGTNTPYFYNQIAYMRNDTSTIPVNNYELTQLIMKGQNLTFDRLNSGSTDLTFNYFENKIIDTLNVDKLEQQTLVTLGLIHNDQYNNAGALFADNADILHSYVDIAKFGFDMDVFEDRIILKNNSILQYYDYAINMFTKYYPIVEKVSVPRRVQLEQIPEFAFKEALANAIVHRDYLIKGGIQIAMYNNRVEIRSPGGLPKGVTKELYLDGLTSITRNPVVSYIFYRLGIIEQFGTGVRRIIKSYDNYMLKPHFEINEQQIKVILPVINFDYSVLRANEAILLYLAAQPESTRQKMEENLGIEKATLLRRIDELINDNRIVRVGYGNQVKYKLN